MTRLVILGSTMRSFDSVQRYHKFLVHQRGMVGYIHPGSGTRTRLQIHIHYNSKTI